MYTKTSSWMDGANRTVYLPAMQPHGEGLALDYLAGLADDAPPNLGHGVAASEGRLGAQCCELEAPSGHLLARYAKAIRMASR
jgi:hypothetical protein